MLHMWLHVENASLPVGTMVKLCAHVMNLNYPLYLSPYRITWHNIRGAYLFGWLNWAEYPPVLFALICMKIIVASISLQDNSKALNLLWCWQIPILIHTLGIFRPDCDNASPLPRKRTVDLARIDSLDCPESSAPSAKRPTSTTRLNHPVVRVLVDVDVGIAEVATDSSVVNYWKWKSGSARIDSLDCPEPISLQTAVAALMMQLGIITL